MAHWAIYTLLEPGTNDIRYVGVTHRAPRQRLCEHISKANCRARGRSHRECWIRSLLKRGLRPAVEVIERGEGEAWPEVEMKWIAIYRSLGARLVNATDGGDGTSGHKWSAEERAAIGERTRNIHRGMKRTPESRALMSETQKRIYARMREEGTTRPPRIVTDELREKLSVAQRGKKVSPAARARMSERNKQRGAETREKLRQAVLRRPEEVRQAFAQANKGRKFSDEHRAKIAEGARLRWAKKRSES